MNSDLTGLEFRSDLLTILYVKSKQKTPAGVHHVHDTVSALSQKPRSLCFTAALISVHIRITPGAFMKHQHLGPILD